MATVRFLAEARIDAQVAWAFYARQSAQAAQRFEDQLERAQERLTQQPGIRKGAHLK